MKITVNSNQRTSSPSRPHFREKDAVCIERRAAPRRQEQSTPQSGSPWQLARLHILAHLMGQAHPSAPAMGALEAYSRIGNFAIPSQSGVRI